MWKMFLEWLDGEMEEIDTNSQTLDVEDMINLESSISHAILDDKVGTMLLPGLNPLEVTHSHGTDDGDVSWGFD